MADDPTRNDWLALRQQYEKSLYETEQRIAECRQEQRFEELGILEHKQQSLQNDIAGIDKQIEQLPPEPERTEDPEREAEPPPFEPTVVEVARDDETGEHLKGFGESLQDMEETAQEIQEAQHQEAAQLQQEQHVGHADTSLGQTQTYAEVRIPDVPFQRDAVPPSLETVLLQSAIMAGHFVLLAKDLLSKDKEPPAPEKSGPGHDDRSQSESQTRESEIKQSETLKQETQQKEEQQKETQQKEAQQKEAQQKEADLKAAEEITRQGAEKENQIKAEEKQQTDQYAERRAIVERALEAARQAKAEQEERDRQAALQRQQDHDRNDR